MDSICARSVVSSENVCSWLMDFGPSSAPISLSNQPPASRPRDLPASARPHLPKRCSRKVFVEARQVPDLADAQRVKLLLRHFAHARDLAHVERREKGRLLPRNHPQHAIGLGLIGADLGHQARGGDADGTVQAGLRLHALVQQVGRAQGRPIQALGARHVQVGFVDGGHLHQGRERLQHIVDLVRVVAVAVRDGRRRKWLAGTAYTPCAAAGPSGRRTCAPRRMRPRPRRARWAARPPPPACP